MNPSDIHLQKCYRDPPIPLITVEPMRVLLKDVKSSVYHGLGFIMRVVGALDNLKDHSRGYLDV